MELNNVQNPNLKTYPKNDMEQITHDIETFHTEDNATFVLIPNGNHKEVCSVDSFKLKNFIGYRYYKLHNKAIGKQKGKEILDLLKAKALFEGPQHNVFLRTAYLNNTIYIDLVNDNWEMVEITSKGWRVLSSQPVYFQRRGNMKPLPTPQKDGSLQSLRPYVNIANDTDFMLLLGWMLEAYRYGFSKPILNLQGVHGSAKSTSAAIIRSLIDPATPLSYSLPGDEKDLYATAKSNWVLCFDNVSKIHRSKSDSFCRISSGGGFSKRKLYSDAEEVSFNITRPIIFNGIEEYAVQPDLIDRMLTLYLPPIGNKKRMDEDYLWQQFNHDSPYILGAFFDALSRALRELDSVHLESKPRMADFARFATAGEGTFGMSDYSFMDIFEKHREKANYRTIENDPIASAIIQLGEENNEWKGTASELLDILPKYTSEKNEKSHLWPKNPRSLSNLVRNLIPSLQTAGIDILPPDFSEWVPEQNKTQRLFRIRIIDSSTRELEDDSKIEHSPKAATTDLVEANIDKNWAEVK